MWGLGYALNFPFCPKWGEHRKEREPNRRREKRRTQERECARERKDNQVSCSSGFNPLAFFISLLQCTPPLISLLVQLLFLGIYIHSCLYCCCRLHSLYSQFLHLFRVACGFSSKSVISYILLIIVFSFFIFFCLL